MIKGANKIVFTVLICVIFVAKSNANGAGLVFTKNLAFGMRGNDVFALQQNLINNGFLKIPAPTGYFGSGTRKALALWQSSVGISPSVGYFGSISRAKMNITTKQASAAIPSTQGAIATAATTTGITPVSVATATMPVGTTTVPVVSIHDGSPVRLTIPKINVDAGFQYTGITPDGVMEIPNNIVDIGWFTGSQRPGEKGVSIITGHVAQIRGGVVVKPGVFNNLNELRAGDKLYVLNDRGESIQFVVRESRNYEPSANTTDVFTSTDDGAHLNIITCEGTWNPEKLSYSQRLVVFTDAVR